MLAGKGSKHFVNIFINKNPRIVVIDKVLFDNYPYVVLVHTFFEIAEKISNGI